MTFHSAPNPAEPATRPGGRDLLDPYIVGRKDQQLGRKSPTNKRISSSAESRKLWLLGWNEAAQEDAASRLKSFAESKGIDFNKLVSGAARHFTSASIARRTSPLSSKELERLFEDDQQSFDRYHPSISLCDNNTSLISLSSA